MFDSQKYLDKFKSLLVRLPRAQDEITQQQDAEPTCLASRLLFGFNHPRSTEKGEDADPIAEALGESSVLICVFDGVGGAGSTVYSVENGTFTGARIAAILARDTVLKYFESHIASGNSPLARFNSDELKGLLTRTLREKADSLETTGSRLKSKLIKRMPTTVAGLYLEFTPRLDIDCLLFWAGDSRCYTLSAEGLRQLTVDDLRSRGDALENIKNDSVLSNYVNADTDYYLNQSRIKLSGPSVFVAATDGCFGYLFTPAHFENLLLETLANSSNVEEWRQNLIQELQAFAGDDASMAVVVVGCNDLAQLQSALEPRRADLKLRYIQPLEEAKLQIQRLEEQRQVCARELDALRDRLWANYKVGYNEWLERADDQLHPSQRLESEGTEQ